MKTGEGLPCPIDRLGRYKVLAFNKGGYIIQNFLTEVFGVNTHIEYKESDLI